MAGRKKSAMGTTQFINQKMLQEAPIFSKKKIDNSEFKPQHPLTHLVVANNFIVMALANKTLKRRDLEDPNSKEEEIDLKKTIMRTSAKIAKLFLDPTGNHLLIAVKSALENDNPALYYLHKTWTQPRQLFNFDKILITAVGWNYAQVDALDIKKSGPILIGTTVGKILETELNAEEGFLGNAFGMTNPVETAPTLLYQIEKGQSNQNEKITGLQYFLSKLNSQKYFITVTTPTRLYQFIGSVPRSDTRPLLSPIFDKYIRGSEYVRPLSELPPSSPKSSSLSFFFNQEKREYNQILNPEKIGWMSELFLFWGGIQSSNDDRTVIEGGRTIPFEASGSEDDIPRQAFITEFHALILYKKKLRGICLLNDQEIFVDQHDGTLVGMAQDQMKNIFWVFTEYSVFKYQVSNEGRHVWRIYLDQERFREAGRLAQMHAHDQPEALDIVRIREAEKLYSDGDYITSAMTYAKTKTSFEEVTLKFVDLEDKTALKNYLRTKLENLKPSEATQSTLVIMWLIEIHQNQLGTMRQCGKVSDDQKKMYQSEEKEFFLLLSLPQVEKCIKENKEVVYNLLGSHGDMRSLVHLAEILHDTERVIRYNLANKQFDKVLELLASAGDQRLVYTHCHVLLSSDPARTVDKLMQMDRVDPLKLIPAFMNVTQSNPEVVPHCVRYLEYAVKEDDGGVNNKAEAVHNLLVFLYIQHDSDKFLNYITTRSHLYCDLKYALKLCVEADRKREAVHLYTRLEQHERAVELALSFDIDLAADCASGNLVKHAKKEMKKELKQKLWLIVAKHVVSEEGNIENAMEFLKNNKAGNAMQIITIEDILPFFNDFVTIDNFKEAICDSLQEYSENIRKLKKEMKQASDSAKVIRDEIVAAKTEHHYVKSTDRCDLSSELLMTKPFYIFSCGHKYIADYLADAVENYLEPKKKTELHEIRSRIQMLESERNIKIVQNKLDQAYSELEEIIASDCLFCGDLMVKNVDTLFIASEEFDRRRDDWL